VSCTKASINLFTYLLTYLLISLFSFQQAPALIKFLDWFNAVNGVLSFLVTNVAVEVMTGQKCVYYLLYDTLSLQFTIIIIIIIISNELD